MRTRLERAALVSGMALDYGHDRWNEIVAALELYVDVGPRIVAELAQADEPIEREDGPRENDDADDERDGHRCYASSSKERTRGWDERFSGLDPRTHSAVCMPASRAASSSAVTSEINRTSPGEWPRSSAMRR